jgi:hypothetical protein
MVVAGFAEQLVAVVAVAQDVLAVAAVEGVRAGVPVAEVLPRLGIPSDVLRSGGPGYQTVPGLTGWSAAEVHVCPLGACGRTVRREPGGPVPDERCWVLDEPLRRA